MSMEMEAGCLAPRLAGLLVAVPTPFRNGALDLDTFSAFCAHLLVQGAEGLIVCDAAGEGVELDAVEYAAVIAAAVRQADGRWPVVASIFGLASTAITMARVAEAVGADAVLVAAPLDEQRANGVVHAHFQAVHDAIALPILLDDMPRRHGIPLSLHMIEALAQLPRVLGLRDASGDLARPVRIRELAGPAFVQLCGNDATLCAHLAQGGTGCVSLTANVAPACAANLLSAWRSGDRAEAARLRDVLAPLHVALALEPAPLLLKVALARQGHMATAFRLPLPPATAASEDAIDRALALVMPVERLLARSAAPTIAPAAAPSAQGVDNAANMCGTSSLRVRVCNGR